MSVFDRNVLPNALADGFDEPVQILAASEGVGDIKENAKPVAFLSQPFHFGL